MLKSCDTMVALGSTTEDGQVIFGKNSDRPAIECQPLVLRERRSHPTGSMTKCQFVELPQVSTTYRHIGSTPYWCWGDEHGFNEHQVVIGNEGLGSKYEFDSPKLIGMELIRLGLERAKTAAEAVEVMTGLVSTYGQGKFANSQGVRTYDNGYIIADPHEAYILETAGHEWAVKKVEGAAGISNVYSLEADWDEISPTAVDQARAQGWWTKETDPFNFAQAYSRQEDRSLGSGAMRRKRSCAVLDQYSGRIDVQAMISLLGDHSDGQTADEPFQTDISQRGICVHHNADGTGGNTAASLVAHLCDDGSRLPVYWCSFYSPCLGVFLPIFVEGDLPSVLGMGDENLSNDSPWWLFRRLSVEGRSGAIASVSTIRKEWRDFQSRLFVSAYEMARECKTLMENGRSEEARGRLTSYMEGNTETMLAMVRKMLSTSASSDGIAAD